MIMNDAPRPRDSSKTALGVAALRAVHQLVDGEPKVLDDPIAARLLNAEALKQMQASPRVHEPWTKGMRAHVVLRSRHAEERMALAAQRGLRQCVMLGAGYDTFAYRQPGWARDWRIYEVDHPGTQEDKRRRLRAAGIAVPANLAYVAIDFESVSLRDGLRASTLDFSRPAFFSCLGVLVYLTRAAVEAVFQLVASFPEGSEIVFTFSAPESAQSPVATRAQAAGEPWQTHFEPETLRRELAALGFSEISFLTPEEAQRAYFQGRTDGLQAPRRGSIASAIIVKRPD